MTLWQDRKRQCDRSLGSKVLEVLICTLLLFPQQTTTRNLSSTISPAEILVSAQVATSMETRLAMGIEKKGGITSSTAMDSSRLSMESCCHPFSPHVLAFGLLMNFIFSALHTKHSADTKFPLNCHTSSQQTLHR